MSIIMLVMQSLGHLNSNRVGDPKQEIRVEGKW